VRWRPGEHILMRYGRNGRFYGARPLRVVGDGGGYVAAWLAGGTPIMIPRLADGRPIRSVPIVERVLGGRSAVPGTWEGAGILKLIPAAGAYSVWLFWHENGVFLGWYVNLEERHRFWAGGIDTRDHVLDLWVEPDGSWQWKDEAELAAAVEYGALTAELAKEIRAEGERVAGMVERWECPFADGWERWRPDPAWPLPALPADWAAR
jgi:uncharacterized protein